MLSERLIRLEWDEAGEFEDRATLRVCNRRLPAVEFTARVTKRKGADELVLETEYLTLRYRDTGHPFSRGNLSVRFDHERKRSGRWHWGMKDRRNLGGTIRTLDGAIGSRHFGYGSGAASPEEAIEIDLGEGLLSRSGWSIVDDSDGIVLDPKGNGDRPWVAAREQRRRNDAYLFAHGHDFKAALVEAGGIFGHQPLLPRYALGTWYSRYWAYTDREVEELIEEFDSQSIPLDVMVIDMDWHLPGWTGYTWDRRYFPDPKEFLEWLHGRGVKTTLNLHPATGVGKHEEKFPDMCRSLGLDPKRTENIPFDCTDPSFVSAYFEHLHHPQERIGVDFWWMDWQQGKETSVSGLDPLPWINQLHWQDQQRTRPHQRPLSFSRYGGIGSGRHPVGFSGDTICCWETLAYQPYFTATASNVLYGTWSHDIGGHISNSALDPELYTRWIQFGIFSPIFRTHTTKNLNAERRVWKYPDPFSGVMKDAIHRRYDLAPYTYGALRDAAETGVSLLRPMYYEYPEVDAAYEARDQYMFGDSLLVAPVLEPRSKEDAMSAVRVWLPRGDWFDVALGQRVRGDGWQTRRYLIDEIPVFVRPGTIVPGQRDATRLGEGGFEKLVFTLYPGGDGAARLYEDDGISTAYLEGRSIEVPISQRITSRGRSVRIAKARGSYDGFIPRRALDLQLPGSAPPRSVRFGKRELRWRHRLDERPGWSYRAETATLVIRTPGLDLRKGAIVRIEEDPTLATRSADGLAGLFRRLKEISRCANLVSPSFQLHPDERMAVEAYQIANLIERDPSRYTGELRHLRRLMKRLPDALDAFAAAYIDLLDPDGHRRGILHRAGRILATTRKQLG